MLGKSASRAVARNSVFTFSIDHYNLNRNWENSTFLKRRAICFLFRNGHGACSFSIHCSRHKYERKQGKFYLFKVEEKCPPHEATEWCIHI